MAMPCFIHGRKQICKSASHGSDLSWASSLTSAETLSSCLVSFAVFWRAGKWEGEFHYQEPSVAEEWHNGPRNSAKKNTSTDTKVTERHGLWLDWGDPWRFPRQSKPRWWPKPSASVNKFTDLEPNRYLYIREGDEPIRWLPSLAKCTEVQAWVPGILVARDGVCLGLMKGDFFQTSVVGGSIINASARGGQPVRPAKSDVCVSPAPPHLEPGTQHEKCLQRFCHAGDQSGL